MPKFNVPQYALPTPQAQMFTPRLPYGRLQEEQIRQQARYLPQLYEVERQRKIQEERQALEKRTIEAQRRQYKLGLGIEVGKIATEAGLPQRGYRAIQKRYFTEPYYKAPEITSDCASRALRETATRQAFGPETYLQPDYEAVPTGLQAIGQSYGVPTTAAGQVMQPALPVPQLGALGQPTTEMAPSLLGRAGELAKTAGPQVALTAASYQAGRGLERAGFPEWIEKTGIAGEEESKYISNITGGAATGAMIGTYIFPGIGTLAGAVAGGMTGLARSIFG